MPGINASDVLADSSWPTICLTSTCPQVLLENHHLADWIEWRADLLDKQPSADFNPQKILWTYRNFAGRLNPKENEERSELLIRALHQYGLVDMQLDHDEALIRTLRPALAAKVIVSHHGHFETIDQVRSLLMRLRYYKNVRYWKLALTFDQAGLDHLIEVFKLILLFEVEFKSKIIFIPIGEYYTSWRILASYYCAPWLFSSKCSLTATAPGQLSFKAAQALKRSQTPEHIVALLGDPVDQSVSHLSHNYAFKLLNVNCCYLKFCVPKAQISSFMNFAFHLCLHGFSVTTPYKESIIYTTTARADSVFLTQAANTLTYSKQGWIADNTDYKTFIHLLSVLQPYGHEPILILGAGGAARAAGYALKYLGLEKKVFIANRTHAKAVKLANEIGAKAIKLEELGKDLLSQLGGFIQTSRLGMQADCPYPFHFDDLNRSMWLMEIVNRCCEQEGLFALTPLAQYWQNQGSQLIDAKTFFYKQASYQFQNWFGLESEISMKAFESYQGTSCAG